MRERPEGTWAGVSRRTALLLTAVVAVVAAACGSSVSPAVVNAQRLAQEVNLQKLDLPAGWSPQAQGSGTPSTAATLSAAETKTVDSVIGSLPASCQGLRSIFISSLRGAPPPGNLAQNKAAFSSAADGNTTISSIVVVFGTPAQAQSVYSSYAAPTFAGCLQSFLGGVISKIFNLDVHQESVSAVPVGPPPAGVEATGLSVVQAAGTSGQQTKVSASQEDVVHAGRTIAFIEVQSQTTSIPTDAQTVFAQSVSTVEHRLAAHPG